MTMRGKLASIAFLVALALIAAARVSPLAQALKPGEMLGPLAPGGIVTMGLATDVKPGHSSTSCPNTEARFPAAGMPANAGTVRSADGRTIMVPLTPNDGPFAVDLYNDCAGKGDNPDWQSQLKTVVIDADGVEITGFIHADNYFELWVNGRFVGRDSIGMVPFNTAVVRFRAKYPITYAIKAVDWESHPGIGMEYANFNIGDGGVIAYFSDGTRTDATWKAETFYVAPLDDPSCVRVTAGGGRDSTFCSQAVRPNCGMDPKTCSALHFPIPNDWTVAKFDDSRWPPAAEWPAALVTDHPSYTRHAKVFEDARFIWTRNLRLDNLVLARHTVTGPRRR